MQFIDSTVLGYADAPGTVARCDREKTDAGEGALEAVVCLSEAIKEVTEHARQLYLSALNAMFSARRAGHRTAGFSTVTAELRVFSRRVIGHMERLAGKIDLAVQQVSRMQKQRRMQVVARAAVAASGADRTSLVAFLARADRRTEDYALAVAETRHALREQLRTALRLCRVGGNLAVQAKVEATCAETAEATAELAQVAMAVERNVAAIERTISAEYRHLKG